MEPKNISTELMFHGLADGTTLASFYGLCSKAGPVRRCIIQTPNISGYQYSNSRDPNLLNAHRSRRMFGLVDYVHPLSVPLAKLIFQQQTYREVGVSVSEAALNMNFSLHSSCNVAASQLLNYQNSGNGKESVTHDYYQQISCRNNAEYFGCEVALYNIPSKIDENFLLQFLHSKSVSPVRISLVTAASLLPVLQAHHLDTTIRPESLLSGSSAAVLLLPDYMSAKIVSFTACSSWGCIGRRLVGHLHRDWLAASSLYADLPVYYRVRMITKQQQQCGVCVEGSSSSGGGGDSAGEWSSGSALSSPSLLSDVEEDCSGAGEVCVRAANPCLPTATLDVIAFLSDDPCW